MTRLPVWSRMYQWTYQRAEEEDVCGTSSHRLPETSMNDPVSDRRTRQRRPFYVPSVTALNRSRRDRKLSRWTSNLSQSSTTKRAMAMNGI